MYLFMSLLIAIGAGLLIGAATDMSWSGLGFAMSLAFCFGALGNRLQMIVDIRRIARRIRNE